MPALPQPAGDPVRLESLFRALENSDYVGDQAFYRTKLAELHQQLDADNPQQLRRYQRLACWSQEDASTTDVQAAIVQADLWLSQSLQAGDQAAAADFQLCRGWYRQFGNDYAGAREDFDAALALAETAENQRLIADALGARAELLALQGDLGQALADLQVAHQIYHLQGNRYWSAYTLSMIANTYRRMGDFRRARELLLEVEALQLARKDEDSARETRYLLALTLEELGESEAALRLHQEQLDYHRSQQQPWGVLVALMSIADNRLRAGDLPAAKDALKAGEPLLDPDYDATSYALWHLFSGQAAFAGDDAVQALAHVRQAEHLLAEQENLRYLAWVQKLKADSLGRLGQWQEAYQAQVDYQASRDELAQRLREQTSTRLRIEFDSARKEAENSALKAETRVQAQRLAALKERRRWQTAVFLLSAMLLLLLSGWAIRQWRRSRKMQLLAHTDDLTGLPNRRAIYASGDWDLRRCHANQAAFSLLVFDVDYFKRINDTWGHEVGDRVLRRVALAATEGLRQCDRVGRTGGEEFLVTLPGADADKAMEIGQRLRRRIEEISLRDVADDLSVTVSVGVAQYRPEDGSLNRLVQRADNALYAAKNAGRNQVELEP